MKVQGVKDIFMLDLIICMHGMDYKFLKYLPPEEELQGRPHRQGHLKCDRVLFPF